MAKKRSTSAQWVEADPEVIAQTAQAIVDVLEVAEATNTDAETTRIAIKAIRDTAKGNKTGEWYGNNG